MSERLTERTAVGIVGNNREVTNYPLYKVAEDDPLDHNVVAQCFEKLAEYEDLEEQGLLLRLPCKIGDTVYTVCDWGIESGVVGSIEIIANRIFVNNIYGAMIAEAHNIFLTREEAERALAEKKGV